MSVLNDVIVHYQCFLFVTVLCPSRADELIKSTSNLKLNFAVLNKSSGSLTTVLLTGANKTILAETPTFYKYWNLETVPIYLTAVIGPLLCFRSPTFFTKFTSLGKHSEK